MHACMCDHAAMHDYLEYLIQALMNVPFQICRCTYYGIHKCGYITIIDLMDFYHIIFFFLSLLFLDLNNNGKYTDLFTGKSRLCIMRF